MKRKKRREEGNLFCSSMSFIFNNLEKGEGRGRGRHKSFLFGEGRRGKAHKPRGKRDLDSEEVVDFYKYTSEKRRLKKEERRGEEGGKRERGNTSIIWSLYRWSCAFPPEREK